MRDERDLYQRVWNELQKHNQLHLLKWYASLGEKRKKDSAVTVECD